MINLKFFTAVLVFCNCNYIQVFGFPMQAMYYSEEIGVVIPSAGSISHNKMVYSLCHNNSDYTTVQCNVYAKSIHFGETIKEICPVELNPATGNSTSILTGKTLQLMSDDKVMLVWQEVSERWEKNSLNSTLPITMHIHLIDLNSCDVLKDISIDAHLRSANARETEEYNVIFLQDGSFQVGYFNLNPNSTSIYDRYLPYYVVYNKNGNEIVPAQSPDIPDILNSNTLHLRTYRLLRLNLNHWLPISPAEGHYFLSVHKMPEFNEKEDIYSKLEVKLSAFTSNNKLKVTKNLGVLKNIKAIEYGHGNVAYCVKNNKPSSLRCFMLDPELNIVYNATLYPGFESFGFFGTQRAFGKFDVKIYLTVPNEMLVVVGDRPTPLNLWDSNIFKINSAGLVSKPVVLNLYNDNAPNKDYDSQYLTIYHDRVCFQFFTPYIYVQTDNMGTCINKQALDVY